MCTFAPVILFKHTNPIIDQWQQHSKVTVGEKDHLHPVSFNCVTSLSPSLSVPKECQVIMLIFLTGFSDFFWLFPKHQYNSFYMSFLNSICSIILDLQCVWCRVSWRKNKLKELSRVKVEVSMLDVISGLMDSAAANHVSDMAAHSSASTERWAVTCSSLTQHCDLCCHASDVFKSPSRCTLEKLPWLQLNQPSGGKRLHAILQISMKRHFNLLSYQGKWFCPCLQRTRFTRLSVYNTRLNNKMLHTKHLLKFEWMNE